MKTLWNGSKPLTIVGIAMIPLFFLSVVGIFVDPRIITGAPAWLKPAKFAISIAIYVWTLAWIFNYLTRWPRLAQATGWITAIAMALEIAIIDAQAYRGTTSHFNTSTPFDARLFAVMGAAIAALWLASAVIAVALFLQPFQNKILGNALRLGMALTVLGSASGGLMVRPTAQQLVDVKRTHQMPRVGAHTVGGLDGGPGLTVTGWSTEHGDLRVPHFLGLHGVQFISLLALFLIRKRVPEERGVRLIRIASASYLALYILLLVEATRGQPVISVSTAMLVATTGWLAFTVASAAAAWRTTYERG